MSVPIRVLGLGAGGHAKVVIETLAGMGGYAVIGLLDPRTELYGTTVLGVPVLGGDELLERQYDDGVTHAFIGVGGVGHTRPRRLLYELVRRHRFDIVSVVHPRAIVSPSASVGGGATILAGAVVNADARIGENVILNSGALVEHECVIGNHVHIAPGALLASGVTVEDGAHVGLGSCVRQGVHIGAGAIIGAGAAVVANVEAGVIVAGVPARVLRPRDGT